MLGRFANSAPDGKVFLTPAVKREAQEEWDELFVYNRHRHLDI
jgi:hypothetical protein